MFIKLTVSNFFKYYVVHPNSKDLTKRDRWKATFSSIAAAFLFFIPHAVAKFGKFTVNHPINNPSVKKTTTVASQVVPTPKPKTPPPVINHQAIIPPLIDKKSQSDVEDPVITQSKQSEIEEAAPIAPSVKERFETVRSQMEEKLESAKTLTSLSTMDPKTKFTRLVSLITDDKENPLFYTKMLRPKADDITMQFDAIAYLIDSVFGFDVVPPTLLVSETTPMDASFIQVNQAFHFPFILQQAVEVNNDQQIHRNKDFDKKALDQRQIQKAILFNMIVGKHDGRADNSVIDSDGRVFEIDNEQIGRSKTDSWMVSKYADLAIDKDLIELIVNTPTSAIEEAFALLENADEVVDCVQDCILDNLQKMQSYFSTNKDHDITVQDLKNIF